MRDGGRRFTLPASTSAMLILVLGFAGLISVGTVLLSLPAARTMDGAAPFITALFTATSAACVTGLVLVESGTYWTGFGQAVILVLMFMGGLGIMTAGTVLLVAVGRRLTLGDRLVLRESMGTSGLGGVTRLGRQIIFFAVGAQIIGFLVLLVHLQANSLEGALWQALFLSISAFNNAGFSILPDSGSLIGYQTDMVVIGVVSALIVFGSVSLPLLLDLWRHRRVSRWTLDTRLVLLGMAGLWVLGGAVMLIFERTNPGTLGPLGVGDQIANALFQSLTSRTAGFSTIDFSLTRPATNVVFMLLMFVGGASGSTAGGIKINTLMVLVVAGYASVRGRPRVEAFRRELPFSQVARALAIVLLAIAVLLGVVLGLAVTEAHKLEVGDFEFLDLLFEAVSALGTTGLSRGITAELTDPGHVILVIGMYLGRLGPLTIALGLALREGRAVYRYAEERVRIG